MKPLCIILACIAVVNVVYCRPLIFHELSKQIEQIRDRFLPQVNAALNSKGGLSESAVSSLLADFKISLDLEFQTLAANRPSLIRYALQLNENDFFLIIDIILDALEKIHVDLAIEASSLLMDRLTHVYARTEAKALHTLQVASTDPSLGALKELLERYVKERIPYYQASPICRGLDLTRKADLETCYKILVDQLKDDSFAQSISSLIDGVDPRALTSGTVPIGKEIVTRVIDLYLYHAQQGLRDNEAPRMARIENTGEIQRLPLAEYQTFAVLDYDNYLSLVVVDGKGLGEPINVYHFDLTTKRGPPPQDGLHVDTCRHFAYNLGLKGDIFLRTMPEVPPGQDPNAVSAAYTMFAFRKFFTGIQINRTDKVDVAFENKKMLVEAFTGQIATKIIRPELHENQRNGLSKTLEDKFHAFMRSIFF